MIYIIHLEGLLQENVPGQYFDFFQPAEREIFVDTGSYDGSTAVNFAKWTNYNYKKIYMFEAQVEKEESCRRTLELNNVDNYELIMKGTWNKKDKLYFGHNSLFSSASRISDDGDCIIEVISIDEVLKGEVAAFIKMDVEGSEYQSIEGARKTIIKYHPWLAISAYHELEDFIKLPLLIWYMPRLSYCL